MKLSNRLNNIERRMSDEVGDLNELPDDALEAIIRAAGYEPVDGDTFTDEELADIAQGCGPFRHI